MTSRLSNGVRSELDTFILPDTTEDLKEVLGAGMQSRPNLRISLSSGLFVRELNSSNQMVALM